MKFTTKNKNYVGTSLNASERKQLEDIKNSEKAAIISLSVCAAIVLAYMLKTIATILFS